MKMEKKTYSVVVVSQNTWSEDAEGKVIDHIESDCGHKHRTIEAAVKCYSKLTATNSDGSCDASWYRAEVRYSDGAALTDDDKATVEREINYAQQSRVGW